MFFFTPHNLVHLSASRKVALVALAVGLWGPAQGIASDELNHRGIVLGPASARFENGQLTVCTGAVERKWQWTGSGLQTISLRDASTGREYAVAGTGGNDWELPGVLSPHAGGSLVKVTARTSDDDGFTGKFIEVVATVSYLSDHLQMQYVVWAFPGAPGLRTQLRLKALDGFDPTAKQKADPKDKPPSVSFADRPYIDCGGAKLAPGARVELLPLDFSVANSRRYWGYYNDPGNRASASTPMLEEKVIKGWPVFQNEVITWASGESVDFGGAGVIVVKESAKAVNQPAHLTGAFFSSPKGLAVTGPGVEMTEIVPDRFRECWATWAIVYSGGDDGMQKALKQFDAARYPVFPKRDLFILSNTWGPAAPIGTKFAAQDHVLREISEGAKLGIDVVQIDDGWQKSGGGSGARSFLPKYENGWAGIKAAADHAGVRMGLWVAIRNADLADLKKDIDELGFIAWKADFDHLASRGDYESRISKFREVMKYAPEKTQFSLCPEYEAPRYGWYYAREYGSIFFQNIQEGLPAHLTFVPFQVLHQHWFMAKYFPANKLQVMLQNPKRTRKDFSDASLHSHAYCFAMGLPFVPCFFQSSAFLDEAGKKELTALISAYKTSREDIFTATTYPIGDEPCNGAWTGFQMVSNRRNGGHLLLFRELHNQEPQHAVQLKFLAGKSLLLTNLMSGEHSTITVNKEGNAEFQINDPADFRLLRYEVVSTPTGEATPGVVRSSQLVEIRKSSP